MQNLKDLHLFKFTLKTFRASMQGGHYYRMRKCLGTGNLQMVVLNVIEFGRHMSLIKGNRL